MMGLVDYAYSDEDEDMDESSNPNCSTMQLPLDIAKNTRSKHDVKTMNANGLFSKSDDDDDDGDIVNNDVNSNHPASQTSQASVILANLPPSIQSQNTGAIQENELDDLVKPKDWELKLAKKIQNKRNRHHRKSNGDKSSKEIKSGKNAKQCQKREGKIVIDAFGGLKKYADGDDDQEDSDEQRNHPVKAAFSVQLLTVLPVPRSASKRPMKENIFLPSNLQSAKNSKKQKDSVTEKDLTDTKSVAHECCDDSDDDYDLTDIFGLKTTSDIPSISNIASVSDNSQNEPCDEIDRRKYLDAENDLSSSTAKTAEDIDKSGTSAPDTFSGIIDDSKALSIIHSCDFAPHDGTVADAAKALENMVDVSVDQVLGPNVQATLLKNLHNKSLAEAALSHIANLPKSNSGVGMVAKRKHQITYLADVARAREEQLAEQWSQNRHNKRVSANRYGF